MNVLLKDRASQVKQDKQDLSSEVKILEAEVKQIEGLIARNNEFFQKRLNEIQSQVDAETSRYNDLENQINGLGILEENDERPLLNRSRQIDDLISKANYRFQELEKEHEFFQGHHQCSTCRQDIDQTHKEDIISTLLIKKQDICKAVEELQDKLLKTQRELFELQQENIKIREQQNQVRILKNEQSYVKSKIIDLNKEIDKIQKELLTSAEEFNIINKQVDLNFQKKKLDDLDIRNRIILISQSFLKDTGIKARIISEYIPLINGLINKYLDAMNFMVSFELSETFEETIKSRYRDTFSYNSFSEGEKFRINLAILFAWRDIARLRNSVASNLLLMDEVLDSSLDDDGIDDFFKILKTLDQDTNVFVISHKAEQVIDKFDDVIEFKKVKNFSQMEYKND
jgi:DNA repair exonuclease SbcCD ATPase subunit